MAIKTQYLKPFWRYEYDYKQQREALESACYDAETLKDALDTGVNSIRLAEHNDYSGFEYVGYLGEDGEYQLADEDIDLNTPVEFYSLDRDDDGYTIALFNKKGGK